MRPLALGLALLFVSSGAAHSQDYRARLAEQKVRLQAEMKARCPKRASDIARVFEVTKAEQVALLDSLRPCGAELQLFHMTFAAAHHANEDFMAAAKSYQAALAIEVTESAQVGLLSSLVRLKTRSADDNAKLLEHLLYFEKRTCTRDDLCATLSYVAWHLDKNELTKRSAERAIGLGFPGWQPYFTGGTVYALGGPEDRAKAIEWLKEARRRGGPALIDGFLERLGVSP